MHTPEFRFTTHDERFRKRFGAFAVISQPPPLTYDDFRQGSDFDSISRTDLLKVTRECFQTAKSMVDSLSQQIQLLQSNQRTFLSVNEDRIKNYNKLCVGNSVFLMKLSQVLSVQDNKEDSNDDKAGKTTKKKKNNVTFDFADDKQFCTIKIS